MYIRRVAAIAVVGVLALIAVSSALAETSIALGPLDLTARVAVDVPVQFACDPLDQISGVSISVTIEQASGQKIAHGVGFTDTLSNPALLTSCDGSAHAYTITVLADTSGPPFHGGPAFVRANGGACGFNFSTGFTCESASVSGTANLH